MFSGLSLVSMCINLLQMHLEATYETGNPESMESSRRPSGESKGSPSHLPVMMASELVPKRTILGIFATGEQSPTSVTDLRIPKRTTRSSQTNLSYPALRRLVVTSDGSAQWLTASISSNYTMPEEERSPDDVAKLVQSETDFLILSDPGEDYSESEDINVIAKTSQNS